MAELPNQQKYLLHCQLHWRNSPAENHLLSSPLPLEHLFRSFTFEFKKSNTEVCRIGAYQAMHTIQTKDVQPNIARQYRLRICCKAPLFNLQSCLLLKLYAGVFSNSSRVQLYCWYWILHAFVLLAKAAHPCQSRDNRELDKKP